MRIHLGDDWFLEANGRLIHECGPDVRTAWQADSARCECGARLSRPARRFPAWLLVQNRPNQRAQSDAA
jgi:hypothetical protein